MAAFDWMQTFSAPSNRLVLTLMQPGPSHLLHRAGLITGNVSSAPKPPARGWLIRADDAPGRLLAAVAPSGQDALGRKPALPPALADLESRPRRFTVVKADVDVVKVFIETHAPAH